jgi:hypothetical protein
MAALTFVAVVSVACQGPRLITVDNQSTRQLRVFVTVPGGNVRSVAPAPGSSATVAISSFGDYSAHAVPDAEWLESIYFRRDYLTRQLGDPRVRRSLGVDELRSISDQISELARQIERATEAADGSPSGCSGTIGDDAGTGRVSITERTTGASQAFVLTCT